MAHIANAFFVIGEKEARDAGKLKKQRIRFGLHHRSHDLGVAEVLTNSSFEMCTDTLQGLRTVTCEDGLPCRRREDARLLGDHFLKSSMKMGTNVGRSF